MTTRSELVEQVLTHAVEEVRAGRLCGGSLHTAIVALTAFDSAGASEPAPELENDSEGNVAPAEYESGFDPDSVASDA